MSIEFSSAEKLLRENLWKIQCAKALTILNLISDHRAASFDGDIFNYESLEFVMYSNKHKYIVPISVISGETNQVYREDIKHESVASKSLSVLSQGMHLLIQDRNAKKFEWRSTGIAEIDPQRLNKILNNQEDCK